MRTANFMKLSLPMFLITALTIGCARPDSVVTAEVRARLAADTTINSSELEVSTDKKVVTLTGNLNSQEQKDRVLDIARATSGVVSVVDMISVRTGDITGNAPQPDRTLGEHIDDATITAAVKSRLLEDPQVKGLKIDVDTREGIVFLTGSVRSQEESDRAVQVARGTEHVKDVKPNLVVSRG